MVPAKCSPTVHSKQDRDIVRWFRGTLRWKGKWKKETESATSKCVIFLFNSRFTAYEVEPLIPFRGVRFTLLLAFSWISRKLHHELRRKSGSAGSRGGHATPAPIHQLPFPPLAGGSSCHSRDLPPPYKMPGIKEWSDNLHGYLKSTFISSGHLS